MNTTITNIINDENTLATLLVGMLFGWTPEEEARDDMTNSQEEDMLDDEELAGFGIEDEELPGYTVVIREDREVEVEVWDFDQRFGVLEAITTDNAGPQSAYYTTSGDNPVLACEAELLDMQPRRLNVEDGMPTKAFYSGAVAYKRQHHNLCAWLLAVRKHSGQRAKLQKMWRAFWVKYYSRKADGTLSQWLYAKHVSSIVAAFAAVGIKKTK